MNLLRFVLYLQRSRGWSESGQTMVEYVIALTLICVATVAAFTALQGAISDAINGVANSF
jgi:Flp pilus assembly pilin Flp